MHNPGGTSDMHNVLNSLIKRTTFILTLFNIEYSTFAHSDSL